MKITTIAAAALSLALLAACGKNDQRPAGTGTSAAPRNEAAPTTPQNTPANPSNPGAQDKPGAHPPVQGQVDAKEPAQQKDFKTDGK